MKFLRDGGVQEQAGALVPRKSAVVGGELGEFSLFSCCSWSACGWDVSASGNFTSDEDFAEIEQSLEAAWQKAQRTSFLFYQDGIFFQCCLYLFNDFPCGSWCKVTGGSQGYSGWFFSYAVSLRIFSCGLFKGTVIFPKRKVSYGVKMICSGVRDVLSLEEVSWGRTVSHSPLVRRTGLLLFWLCFFLCLCCGLPCFRSFMVYLIKIDVTFAR